MRAKHARPVTISVVQRRPGAPPPPDGSAGRAGRSAGVAMMLGSGFSNQLGAALGALAFPVLGPAGVVAVRQWVAGVALLAIGRPRLRSFTGRQWRPVLALALVFATMSVALAGSRRRVDLLCALVAGAAVVVLARPEPTTDYLGIALGLLAAVCWASYILLNRVIGQRLPGAEGSAAAAALSALLYVPIGILTLLHHPPTARALGYAAAAGILASAVPFVADVFALRRVPARFFGVFMSVNPVLAALVGLVVLGQSLQWVEWLAIAAIVTASTVSVLTPDHPAPGPSAAARRPRRAAW